MADQEDTHFMSKEEEQQMLLMLQDLGGSRRTFIAECDVPHHSNATPRRTPPIRAVSGSSRRAHHPWGNLAGSGDEDTTAHAPGTLHRQRADRNHQQASEHVDEERSLYLCNRRSTSLSAGHALAGRPRQTLPSNRQRAPSPRAAGTVRFVRGQQVGTPRPQMLASTNGAPGPQPQHRIAAPTGPRALIPANGAPSARSFARSIAAVSAQAPSRPAVAAASQAVPRTSTAAIARPANHALARGIPVSNNPITTSAALSPTDPAETHQAATIAQFAEAPSREDKMLDLALKQYIAEDMSFPQLKEILKQIFDPARAQWLHKHKELLQAFDQVGQAFRCLILQICEQDCASIKSFLRDFGFVPQIKEHVNAASEALKDASTGEEAYYGNKLQYLPFFKMAQRMLQEIKIEPLIDIEADMTYSLLEEMDNNSRAWLSQSPMPAGLVLRNGIYYHA